jgi:electron transfer flavoprotein alpha/beta subunit
MMRVAVIIGSASSATASGAPTLPISDRGAVALAMASFGSDVRAYADDADARCFARAAGVETVEEISDLENDSVDVALLGRDVVLLGRGGCGERGDALPARLAEQRGAALVYEVIDVQREADRLLVTRDLGRGARDLLSIRGRVVLVVADSVERGPYLSRYRIDAARAASGEPVACSAPSGVEWELTTPRVRLGDHASRVAGRAVERMNALFGVGEIAENTASLVRESAEECARQLLRYLSHHGFVEHGPGGEQHSASEGAVASRSAGRRPQPSAANAASIPIRTRRRPRPMNGHPLATRGPFEVGVDV